MKIFNKISSTFVLFSIVLSTSYGITSDELLTFYETVVHNIGNSLPKEEDPLEMAALQQNINRVITPYDGDIDIETEISLREAAETCIKTWLSWHNLPESMLGAAVEAIRPDHLSTPMLQPASRRTPTPPDVFDIFRTLSLTESNKEFPVPATPPPSPANSAYSGTDNFTGLDFAAENNTLFGKFRPAQHHMQHQLFLKVDALAQSHFLTDSQAFVLRTAAMQMADDQIPYLTSLLYFMVSKNFNAFATSSYSAGDLGFDLYTNIDTCLEFYVLHNVILAPEKTILSGLAHTLPITALGSFIATFFSIVADYFTTNFADFISTLTASYRPITGSLPSQSPIKIVLDERLTYHSNTLSRTSHSQLIQYIDNMVYHGLLHMNDGWRLRSILLIAHPQLYTSLMLEAFAISSQQCLSISKGIPVNASFPAALQKTVELHRDRHEINQAECTQAVAAIHVAPSPAALRTIEHTFYRRLLGALNTPPAKL